MNEFGNQAPTICYFFTSDLIEFLFVRFDLVMRTFCNYFLQKDSQAVKGRRGPKEKNLLGLVHRPHQALRLHRGPDQVEPDEESRIAAKNSDKGSAQTRERNSPEIRVRDECRARSQRNAESL